MSIFGTRPEAIKLAPVIRELERSAAEGRLCSTVCITAQHRQMLDQVLDAFGIVPDHDLDIMVAGQSTSRVASEVLGRLEPILRAERPDWVLVQGDTTTVAAAALAAYYAGVKVGHIEAGLRSGDKWQPFPEEINRRVAGVIADLHFAPTDQARRALLAEGVPAGRIVLTGNPIIDALRWVAAQPAPAEVADDLTGQGVPRALLEPEPGPTGAAGRLILVTAHRRENFGAPIEQICRALRDIALGFGERVHVVYPVHPNPNVVEPVRRILGEVPNVTLTAPLDYRSLVYLMQRSYFVMTDSGGLQEEAPSLGKPVLVLRQVTERPDGVEAGVAKLVGADRTMIVEEAGRLLTDEQAYATMARAVNPYGDGHASSRIVQALLDDRTHADDRGSSRGGCSAGTPLGSDHAPREGEDLLSRGADGGAS
jgi:UDP-N-acetylglucosamine 2-epimerase (non-hydrolysing)